MTRRAACLALIALTMLAAALPVLAEGDQKALLADFVEVSSRSGMRHDAALIELVNLSSLDLDVNVGESGTLLHPGERLMAGVQPGSVAVKVMARGVSAAPLEGDLQVDGGRHYELAFAYDVPAELSGEAPAADGGSAVAPAAASGEATQPAVARRKPGSEPRSSDTSRHGKVDLGRKRR